jgi:hypothetical protein
MQAMSFVCIICMLIRPPVVSDACFYARLLDCFAFSGLCFDDRQGSAAVPAACGSASCCVQVDAPGVLTPRLVCRFGSKAVAICHHDDLAVFTRGGTGVRECVHKVHAELSRHAEGLYQRCCTCSTAAATVPCTLCFCDCTVVAACVLHVCLQSVLM